MARHADTDLLPWIMGALFCVIVAAGIVVKSLGGIHPASTVAVKAIDSPDTSRVASASRVMPPIASTMDRPAAADSPAPGAGATPSGDTSKGIVEGTVTPLAPFVAPTLVPAASSDLPPGQVWECLVNGQRTFSDTPCGERPAIRQLSEVNRMAATPAWRGPRLISPAASDSAPGPGYAPDPYPPDDVEPAPETGSGVSYYPLAVRPYRLEGHARHPTPESPTRPLRNPAHPPTQPRSLPRAPMPRER